MSDGIDLVICPTCFNAKRIPRYDMRRGYETVEMQTCPGCGGAGVVPNVTQTPTEGENPHGPERERAGR